MFVCSAEWLVHFLNPIHFISNGGEESLFHFPLLSLQYQSDNKDRKVEVTLQLDKQTDTQTNFHLVFIGQTKTKTCFAVVFVIHSK